MKTPEEILKNWSFYGKIPTRELEKIIEQAQTEAWNEAIEIAAENAETKEIGDKYGHWLADVIDEDSILRLKK